MSYNNKAYSITSKSKYNSKKTSTEQIGFHLDPKDEKRIMDEWNTERLRLKKLKKQNKG